MDINNVISITNDIDELDNDMLYWLNLTYDERKRSDIACIEKHGCTNTVLYNRLRADLTRRDRESLEDDEYFNEDVGETTLEDKKSDHYIEDACLNTAAFILKNIAERKDKLAYAIEAVDFLSNKNLSNYEKGVWESSFDNIKITSCDYSDDIPDVVPYFTFDEYCDMTNTYDITPVNYTFVEDGREYYNTIKMLQDAHNESAQIKLGWNPAVKISPETLKFARERQIEWFNANESAQIIDLSKTINLFSGNNEPEKREIEVDTPEARALEPVYIVIMFSNTRFAKAITTFKKARYSHSGLSLTPKLNQIYSYAVRFGKEFEQNGFGVESLDTYFKHTGYDSDLLVMCIFVKSEIKKQIKMNLDWYVEHQDSTSYSFKNILKIVLNKETDTKPYALQLVCSQFVDSILKMSNIDITRKPSNLVAPSDLQKNRDGVNVYTLYEGKGSKYDYKKIEKKVARLKKNIEYSKLAVLGEAEIIKILKSFNIDEYNIDCNDNEEIKSVLKEIRSYLTPVEAIVYESDNVFNMKDVHGEKMSLEDSIKDAYEGAHKLLSLYDQSNLNGIKLQLAKLFYLYCIVTRKLSCLNVDKHVDEIKKLRDLQDKINSEFNTYIKVVYADDKNFDFLEFVKTTEYYNKTINIGKDHFKYSGSNIKKYYDIIKTYKNKKM